MKSDPGRLRLTNESPPQHDEPWLDFLRAKSTIATPQQYEEMTDVWVFGNERGFRAFARALGHAETSAKTTPFLLSEASPHGMRVVIVPAEQRTARSRLRLWERTVFVKRQLHMELVIYGNAAAYRRLGRIAEKVSRTPTDFDHEHVDWDTDWLIQRSVSLNLRAPFATREEMADQYGVLADKNQNPNFLPQGLAYLTPEDHPYETITQATARAHFPLTIGRFQNKSD